MFTSQWQVIKCYLIAKDVFFHHWDFLPSYKFSYHELLPCAIITKVTLLNNCLLKFVYFYPVCLSPIWFLLNPQICNIANSGVLSDREELGCHKASDLQPWLYIRITWETFETTDDYNVWLGLKTIVKMGLLQVEICKTEPLSCKGIQILISSFVYIVHILLPPSAPPEGLVFFPLGCFFRWRTLS